MLNHDHFTSIQPNRSSCYLPFLPVYLFMQIRMQPNVKGGSELINPFIMGHRGLEQ